MGTITTKDRTQIYYKDWGTGQPVVLSHGWPLNGDSWESQMVFPASNGYRASPGTATKWTPTPMTSQPSSRRST
jgi:pimeloyl-ACP methyl ester carboxylesterase